MSILVAPSMLSADFGNLDKDIDIVNNCGDIFHLDIMDGVFVPNISYGTPVIKAITRRAKRPVEAHLMIVEPEKYVDAFREAGADIITVHLEACPHLHRTLQAINDISSDQSNTVIFMTPIEVLEAFKGFGNKLENK